MFFLYKKPPLKNGVFIEGNKDTLFTSDFFNLAPNFWTYFPLIKH